MAISDALPLEDAVPPGDPTPGIQNAPTYTGASFPPTAMTLHFTLPFPRTNLEQDRCSVHCVHALRWCTNRTHGQKVKDQGHRSRNSAASHNPWIAWLRRNLAGWSKITCRGLNIGQNRSLKLNPLWQPSFSPKPEVVLSPPWIEVSHQFGMRIDFRLLKRVYPIEIA